MANPLLGGALLCALFGGLLAYPYLTGTDVVLADQQAIAAQQTDATPAAATPPAIPQQRPAATVQPMTTSGDGPPMIASGDHAVLATDTLGCDSDETLKKLTHDRMVEDQQGLLNDMMTTNCQELKAGTVVLLIEQDIGGFLPVHFYYEARLDNGAAVWIDEQMVGKDSTERWALKAQ